MEIKQISPPSWSAWAVLSLMLLTDIYKQRYRDKQIFLWRCFISGLYFVHGNYCQTCYLGATEMAGSAVQKAISCLCCKGHFGYRLGFWFLLFNYNLHGLDLGFVSVLGFFFLSSLVLWQGYIGLKQEPISQSLREGLKPLLPYNTSETPALHSL